MYPVSSLHLLKGEAIVVNPVSFADLVSFFVNTDANVSRHAHHHFLDVCEAEISPHICVVKIAG